MTSRSEKGTWPPLCEQPRTPAGHKAWSAVLLFVLLFLTDQAWYIDAVQLTVGKRENPFDEIVAGACWLFAVWAYTRIRRSAAPVRPAFRFVVTGLFTSVALSYLYGSVVLYGQPAERIPNVLFWFGGILAYPALLRLRPTPSAAKQLLYIVIIYGVGTSIFSIVMAMMPAWQTMLTPVVISERFGTIRVARIAGGPMLLAFFYFVALMIVQRPNGQAWSLWKTLGASSGAACTLGCLLFVSMDRRAIAGTIVVMLAVSVWAMGGTILRRSAGVIGVCAASLAAGALLLFPSTHSDQPEYIKNFVESFDVASGGTEGDVASLLVRQRSLEFYWGELVRSRGIGVGWVSQSTDIEGSNEILEAIDRGLFLVDLGWIGSVLQYGAVGLVVITMFFGTTLLWLVRLLKGEAHNTRVIAVTLMCFLGVQAVSVNNIFYWPPFALLYAVIMYVIDVLGNCQTKIADSPGGPLRLVRPAHVQNAR